MDRPLKISVVLSLFLTTTLADIAHFFPSDLRYFSQSAPSSQQHYFDTQQNIFHPLQPPQPFLTGLYGATPTASPAGQQQQHLPSGHGYPKPTSPTPLPVAPIPTSTLAAPEFTLPEIVENRKAKDSVNFIPLSNHYLPPEMYPSYESPKPPSHQGDDNISIQNESGYIYQRPIVRPTTKRPNPIVVLDPPEILPPLNTPALINPPNSQGYDYNAPPPETVPTKPISTPAPVYLPSNDGSSEVAVFEQSAEAKSLRLLVQEMRCLQNSGGFLRAVLKVESFIGATPSVDNDSNDKRCELKLNRSYVIVDLSEEDFGICGVRKCGKDLCLRLRFPAIRGMRTSGDAILTLHCKSQDRVAVKTHAFKMKVANDIQSRSIGTYAHGGSQNPLRTHVELLRKSNNGFTRHLETNGAVQLGEDLLLRAHVLEGDGWNYTKLTDVSLQRISATGELLNLARLVSDHGCLNPAMQGICAHPPSFDPPLGHKLAFKAVMFQGMHSGDELVISMRITGCLEAEDCHISTQDCAGTLGRRRRNTAEPLQTKGDVRKAESSEISRISFRVVMKSDEEHGGDEAGDENKNMSERSVNEISVEQRSLVLYGAVGFVLSLCGLGFFAAFKLGN